MRGKINKRQKKPSQECPHEEMIATIKGKTVIALTCVVCRHMIDSEVSCEGMTINSFSLFRRIRDKKS